MKRYILLKLCFDLCCMAKVNIANSDLIKSTAHTYCPYNDYCTFNKTDTFDDRKPRVYVPCCVPCSCEESCWMLDKCCPDIPSTRPPGHEAVTCKSAMFEYVYKTKPEVNVGDSRYLSIKYQINDKCPLDYNANSVTKNKCNNATQIKPDTLDDIVIVSDAGNHDRIFKNKHCAECHDVTTIERWELKSFGCVPSIYDVSLRPSELMDFLLTRCDIVSTLPEESALYPYSYCHLEQQNRYTTECNVTGMWQTYDAGIERLCHFSHNPLYRSQDRQIYKNVFCFICNNDDIRSLSDTCRADFTVSVDFAQEFSALLDLSLGRTSIMDVKDHLCDTDEIYDYILKTCRQVRCPINTSPYNGKCMHHTINIHGLIVTMILKLIPDKPVFVDEDLEPYNELFFLRHVPILFKILGLWPKCRRAICSTGARVYVDNSTYLQSVNIKLVLATTEGCELNFVERWLNKQILGKHTLLFINGVLTPLRIYVDHETQYEKHQQTTHENVTGHYFGTLFKYQYERCPSTNIVLNGKLFCPYLSFNTAEYRRVKKYVMKNQMSSSLQNTSFFNELMPQFVQILSENTEMVAICLDDFDRYNRSNATALQLSNIIVLCTCVALIMNGIAIRL